MPSFGPHLFDLPFDVLDLILVKLNDADLECLSETCKYMERMVELHRQNEKARKPSKRRRRKQVGPDVDDETDEEEYYHYCHYTGDGYYSDQSDSPSLRSFGSNYYPSEEDDIEGEEFD